VILWGIVLALTVAGYVELWRGREIVALILMLGGFGLEIALVL
jgi:hypothetical protein